MIIHKEYKSIKNLLDNFNFSLEEAEVRIPKVISSITPQLNQNKISSITYLRWAEEDLNKNTEIGYSHSISNSNKGVIRRQDEILSDILDIKSKNLNGKAIFKFLSEDLKISIPNLIKKLIINPRNNLEHDFSIPTESDAKDAYELASLFLASTEKYLTDSLVSPLEIGIFSQEPFSSFERVKKGITISFGEDTRKQGKGFLIYFIDTTDTGSYVIIDSENKLYTELIIKVINFYNEKEDCIATEIKSILLKA